MTENKVVSKNLPPRISKPGFASIGCVFSSVYFYLNAQDTLQEHAFEFFTINFISFLVLLAGSLIFGVISIRATFREVQENPVLIPTLKQFTIFLSITWIVFPAFMTVISRD